MRVPKRSAKRDPGKPRPEPKRGSRSRSSRGSRKDPRQAELPDLFTQKIAAVMEQTRQAEEGKQAAAGSTPSSVAPVTSLTASSPEQKDFANRERGDFVELRNPSEIPKTKADFSEKSERENRAENFAKSHAPISTAVSTPASDEPLQEPLPSRMLNEFAYCPRLFYYEYVEGVFVENADTKRGAKLHKRVDAGSGAMPAAKKSTKDSVDDAAENSTENSANDEPETIHSRSVHLGSERLGVVAKMDLVEVQTGVANGERAQVCPVDYKAGSPREGEDGNSLWDTDKMQLGLQCLILRDNGYACDEGVIYYRGTKQRVRLAISEELEAWVCGKIAAARETARGPIPPPLVSSPKCVRCSLAPVCLPDETRFLAESTESANAEETASVKVANREAAPPRRLVASRNDTRALYLNTPGLHVGRSHEVLQVREKGKLLEEIRISDLCHVSLFGNIQLSTQAVQSLCNRDIPVTWFSMGGWFYGITRGHSLKNVFLRIEQFRGASSLTTSLPLAKAFVHGKIRNQRTMLMRNHVEPPTPILLKLKNSAQKCLRAESLEELLGIEGAAAAFYFQHFDGMLKSVDEQDDAETKDLFRFDFATRNRRPPTDPVNALLSLAYSLLAKECMLAANTVGFDPYIGFYHQPRFGRPALALDVMEEFRPLIAESTVITILNNRLLSTKDFVTAGKAVNLSQSGRRAFFQCYEKRMNALVTHPVFDYKVSYRRAIELQYRLLARVLTGEIPEYIPFMTR